MTRDDVPPQDDAPGTFGRTLRELFPGYFPPTDNELRAFLAEGMVVFDNNALFDSRTPAR